MGLLLEIMDALLGGSAPAANVAAPRRRRRQAKGGRGGRWHRPGRQRFHWHLTPGRTKYFFTQQNGKWRCPFCHCG